MSTDPVQKFDLAVQQAKPSVAKDSETCPAKTSKTGTDPSSIHPALNGSNYTLAEECTPTTLACCASCTRAVGGAQGLVHLGLLSWVYY